MIIVHKNYFSHGPQVVSFQGDWQWIEFHLREMEIGNWIYYTANFMEFKMEYIKIYWNMLFRSFIGHGG